MINLSYLPQLLYGALLTLQISAGAFVLGLFLGFVLLFVGRVASAPVRWLISSYILFVRGLPELLIILLIFYGGTVALSNLAGTYVEINARTAGIVSLGFVAAAYMSEILRGALQSIPVGQWEAAQSLGIGKVTTFSQVILPQVVARALPGLSNHWLIVLKDSALVSVIGLEELTRTGVVAAGATHAMTIYYLLVAALYIAITAVSIGARNAITRKVASARVA